MGKFRQPQCNHSGNGVIPASGTIRHGNRLREKFGRDGGNALRFVGQDMFHQCPGMALCLSALVQAQPAWLKTRLCRCESPVQVMGAKPSSMYWIVIVSTSIRVASGQRCPGNEQAIVCWFRLVLMGCVPRSGMKRSPAAGTGDRSWGRGASALMLLVR